MFDKLRAYFEGKTKLTEEQFRLIESVFDSRKLKKGECLQREGETPKYGGFVISGCLRSYVVDDSGKEHIIQFAPENWWISEFESAIKNEPAKYFIDAIEDSELVLITRSASDELRKISPKYQEFVLQATSEAYIQLERRISSTISLTLEERYTELTSNYPDIIQRLPQHMIASYMGLTPETLSRVRKR